MSTDNAVPKMGWKEFLEIIGLITAVTSGLFTLITSATQNPIAALSIGVLAGVVTTWYLLRTGRAQPSGIIIAWFFAIVVITLIHLWFGMTVVGNIEGTDGSPMINEVVLLFDASGARHETYTDKEGQFKFERIPYGKFKLRVREIESQHEGQFPVPGLDVSMRLPSSAKPTPSPIPTPSPLPSPTVTLTPIPTLAPTSTSIPRITSSPTAISPPSSTPTSQIILFNFEGSTQGWKPAVGGTEGWGENEKAVSVSITNTAEYVSEGAWSLQSEFDGWGYPKGDFKATFYSSDLPLGDWRAFAYLKFDVYNRLDSSTSIEVIPALATGVNSCWTESTMWTRLTTGWNHLTFSLNSPPDYKLCSGIYGPIPERDQVRRLHLVFLLKEPKRGMIFIDNVRLDTSR